MAVTLVHWFEERARTSAHRPAMREKRGGRWRDTSWAQWRETSRTLASALVHFGVERGDRVAVLSGTRQAFWETDIAVLLAGAATVPIYPSLSGDRVAALLRDSGAVVLFAEDPLQVERVAEALVRSPAPALRAIVVFDERAYRVQEDLDEKRAVDVVDLTVSGVEIRALSAWLERGQGALVDTEAELAARLEASSPDDIATLMYTSGTSGEPKGAILTHRCFTTEIEALIAVVQLGPHDEQLLVLPMAHVFGRLLELAQLRVGYVTSFAESAFKIMDNVAEVNPTFLGCVPRFFEKFQAASFERASREGRVREKAFHWSFAVGRAVAEKRRLREPLPLSLSIQHRYADKLALRPVRATFGTRFRFAVSGGAPLARELGEWFDAAGIPVVEGYGLSETTAATHTNRPDRPRYGTVGKALPGLAVRLADDGEILVKGPSVMKGYWNLPEATAEAFDEEGYFRTGDIGTLDKEGYLTITDRKKEIIVTAGGKNIAPRAIENALGGGHFISQAVVCGDRRPYLVALLTLDELAAVRWAREHDRDTSLGALAVDPELRALIAADVDAANATLASFETVKRFHVLPHDFDVAAGELTPTLKVRRRAVLERHREIVEGLYREGDRPREPGGSRPDAGDGPSRATR